MARANIDTLLSLYFLGRHFKIKGSNGTVFERYEYDSYGNCSIYDASYIPRSSSLYGNSYLFTGRRLDTLDSGSLKIQYNRNRYYDNDTGRWLTHDPLGITPNPQKPNRFDVIGQYKDGLSLCEYVGSNPINKVDSLGLVTVPSGFSYKLRRVCYRYKTCCINKCLKEADLLAERYYVQFTIWAIANPGYQECTTLAQEIMGMNLDVGLEYFYLRKMQNWDPSPGAPPAIISKAFGHQWVGVFHKCATCKGNVCTGSSAFCDVRLDPHSLLFIYPPWKGKPLPPKIKNRRYGWFI